MNEMATKLLNTKFETSRPISFKYTSIHTWQGAGLTHVQTNDDFSFEVSHGSLCIMSLTRHLANVFRPSAVDLANGIFANIPDEIYRGACGKPTRSTNVFIVPSLIEGVLDVKYSPGVASTNLRRVRSSLPIAHLLQALLEDVKASSPSGPTLGEAIINAMIALAHPVELGKMEIRDRRTPTISSRKMVMIKDYIQAQLSEPLHLESLAKLADVSIRHLSRSFRSTMGLSPHQYIVRTRVEHAQHLVSTTSLSYDHVAWSSGFSDRNHMASAFRKVLGAPPSHFRNGQKKPD
ncbi:helix-turn-helix domain-containing protein [Bradyrhizobium mercantei]|uniref:helix-turn-helix domain-containing protein n=1 Tax=Bradyrhizobium mercantei TaxID=1904807 RepID=UPI000976A704|nr:helix-turn-helix domain-containing protein [Bradyrhizobium mercantei]